MTTIKPRLMTADEFLEMERIPGKRYELIRGILTEKEVGTGGPSRYNRGPLGRPSVSIHRVHGFWRNSCWRTRLSAGIQP